MAKKQKPQLTLARPTLEDLIALSKKFTGRDPTAEEVASAKASLARMDEKARQRQSE